MGTGHMFACKETKNTAESLKVCICKYAQAASESVQVCIKARSKVFARLSSEKGQLEMQAAQPLFLLLSCRPMDRLLAELIIFKNSKFLSGWLRARSHETLLTLLRCRVAAIFVATSLFFLSCSLYPHFLEQREALFSLKRKCPMLQGLWKSLKT